MLQPASRAHLVGICEMKREGGKEEESRQKSKKKKKNIAVSGKGLAIFSNKVADSGGLGSDRLREPFSPAFHQLGC